MSWLLFIVSSTLLVAAAIKLAEYGDVIALRTGLGGMFIGTLLLAGATSLPEFLTTINSIQQNVIDLAAGNLFGSNMFNMFALALLDLAFFRRRVLRSVAMRHALSGSLAALMIGLVLFFIVANIQMEIGWVGLDAIIIMAAYIGCVYILQSNNSPAAVPEAMTVDPGLPSLKRSLVGFGLATALLVIVTPWLVSSSAAIAEETGISTGFLGTALLAVITSLPELITTFAAVRLGAFDMAVGNLFGSNMFNMFALGTADLFLLEGRFLAVIHPGFVLAALLGLVMTLLGLVGNIARLERRVFFVEVDAGLLVIIYLLGMALLYMRGIGV